MISLRYWKISLLVHPDKCSHPQANQAFIKLNKAFKELQDPEKVSLAGDLFIIEVNVAFGWILHWFNVFLLLTCTQLVTLFIPLGVPRLVVINGRKNIICIIN